MFAYFKRLDEMYRKQRKLSCELAAVRQLLKVFSDPLTHDGHMTLDQYKILNKSDDDPSNSAQLRYSFYDPYLIEERLYPDAMPDAMRERLAERNRLLLEEADLIKQLRELAKVIEAKQHRGKLNNDNSLLP